MERNGAPPGTAEVATPPPRVAPKTSSSVSNSTVSDPVSDPMSDPVSKPARAVSRTADGTRIEVRRSARRRRTVSAYRDGDTVVVLLPAGMRPSQEQRWVTTMLERLDVQERRR